MGGKVIFFDIDGTLLDHNNRLPESTKHSIGKLHRAGHVVAIATARPPFRFGNIAQELGVRSYVSMNGQYVTVDGEVIFRAPLEREKVSSLKKFADARRHPLVFADPVNTTASIADHDDIAACFAGLNETMPQYDPDYDMNREIYQCIVFCKEAAEGDYRTVFPDLHFVRWHDLAMDAIPAGLSKAFGIQKWIERMGVNREDVYAFGDSYNDIEMLEFAGCGIAMGNAPDAVKRAAKLVTKAVNEDGIFHGLQMAGLI